MRLLIIGGTGGIGRQLIMQAKERGHRTTALVRSAEKLADLKENVHVVAGNPLDPEAVKSAVAGHDAVVSALGPPGIGRSTVQQDGARAIVAALRRGPVRRYLVVSAAMLFKDAGVLAAIIRSTILKNVAKDCTQAESAVIDSGLDWTIVRPPRLTNGGLTRSYGIADGRMPEGGSSFVSRANVAHFLLDEAERGEHLHHIVGLA